MFELGQVMATDSIQELISNKSFNVDSVLERHLKLDDDTDGEDRAVNEHVIKQGYGNIISIYNIENKRVYVHTVHEYDGGAYTRIYVSGEY